MKRLVKWFLGLALSQTGVLYRVLPPGVLSVLDRFSTPPAGDRYYGSRAREYEAVRLGQDWWHAEQQAVETALQGLPEVGSVLDVPAGTGRFFKLYKEAGITVSGLDVSEDMIGEARKTAVKLGLGVDLTKGDARYLPYLDDSFDLVVCFRFLQSIIPFRDAKTVIAEISRVTRRYALLELDRSQDGEQRKFKPSEKATMRNRLSEVQLAEMLEEAGFRVVQVFGPFRTSAKSQYGYLCEKFS